jgi:DNA-binding LacI/PurR family transcriptional regulator
MMKLLLTLVMLFNAQSEVHHKTLKISIFYNSNLKGIEYYLKEVFDDINHKLTDKPYQLLYTVVQVSNSDQSKSVRTLCSELEDGRIAIIGIGLSHTFEHLKYVSNALGIPFFSIQWNSIHYEDKLYRDDLSISRQVLNIYPSAIQINIAVNDLITYLKWEQVTILFQGSLVKY